MRDYSFVRVVGKLMKKLEIFLFKVTDRFHLAAKVSLQGGAE